MADWRTGRSTGGGYGGRVIPDLLSNSFFPVFFHRSFLLTGPTFVTPPGRRHGGAWPRRANGESGHAVAVWTRWRRLG